MSISTLVGLVFGVVVILSAMMMGSSIALFVNVPGMMVVIGGTMAATMIRYSMEDTLSAFGDSFSAIKVTKEIRDLGELIDVTEDLIRITRKDGLLALENYEVDNRFYKDGVRMLIDGYEAGMVQDTLREKNDLFIDKTETSAGVFRAIGEAAPAFGMIGTLVGLIQMLANLSDPSSIGPAMAVALLTTLYGALIASLFALPIAGKIESWANGEAHRQKLIIDAIDCVSKGVNPAVMRDILKPYLDSARPKQKDEA
ncbi:MotA/TolQ/ExbB proton channel family protein [Thiomicrospira sp. R3]|uniref:motility protein A n=1 Tax=Thiomicrospira sp. R3 TaxID=3035472 RepID=UPI00259BBF1B|nr:MotA/TolQ/ExbB proton channel family protein [Thiomicrospira sp. R3]WFE69061.1 MotA/TolQ/ExbB proton channel family protein [Thiomicrospira sp. R3]